MRFVNLDAEMTELKPCPFCGGVAYPEERICLDFEPYPDEKEEPPKDGE